MQPRCGIRPRRLHRYRTEVEAFRAYRDLRFGTKLDLPDAVAGELGEPDADEREDEPEERRELAPSTFVFMAEEAAKAATMAVHVQGGLGVSAEAAATAYLVRARGWAVAGGDPAATAKYIATIVAEREGRS